MCLVFHNSYLPAYSRPLGSHLCILQLPQECVLPPVHLNKEKCNDYNFFVKYPFALCSNLGEYIGSAYNGGH